MRKQFLRRIRYDWRVPLADVKFGVEEEQAVQQVLRSGWLSMGEVTKAFEQDFAAFIGAKHTLAVPMPRPPCIWPVLPPGLVPAMR